MISQLITLPLPMTEINILSLIVSKKQNFKIWKNIYILPFERNWRIGKILAVFSHLLPYFYTRSQQNERNRWDHDRICLLVSQL